MISPQNLVVTCIVTSQTDDMVRRFYHPVDDLPGMFPSFSQDFDEKLADAAAQVQEVSVAGVLVFSWEQRLRHRKCHKHSKQLIHTI